MVTSRLSNGYDWRLIRVMEQRETEMSDDPTWDPDDLVS